MAFTNINESLAFRRAMAIQAKRMKDRMNTSYTSNENDEEIDKFRSSNNDKSVEEIGRNVPVERKHEMETFDTMPSQVKDFLNTGFVVKPSAVDMQNGLRQTRGNVDALMNMLAPMVKKHTRELTRLAYGDKHPSLLEQYLMEQLILINENRINWLKENTKELSTDHDTLGEHKDPKDIIDHFAEHADPSKKKLYTQWIVKQYSNQKIRQEDAPRIKQSLESFETNKRLLPHQDINRYDIHSLDEELGKHDENFVSNKKAKQQIKLEGADLVHDDQANGLKVIKLKTQKAATFYGSNTRWCTTSGNYFENYSKQGPIYVMLDGKHNEKYQLHFHTNQFCDATDRNVGIQAILQKYPHLKKVQEFKNMTTVNSMPFKEPHEVEPSYRPLVDEDPGDSNHLEYTKLTPSPTHLDLLSRSKHENIRAAAASNSAAPDSVFHNLVNDPSPQVRLAVAKHSPFAEHSAKLIHDPDVTIRREIAAHTKVQSNLDHLSEPHQEYWTKIGVIQNVNNSKEHLDKIIANDPNDYHLINQAIKNSRHPEHFDWAEKHSFHYVRRAVAETSKNKDQLARLSKDPDSAVAKAAMDSMKKQGYQNG